MTRIMMQELATFLATLNTAKTMSPDQARLFVRDFIALYPNDSVAFVKMFFFKARNGEVGKAYGSIDQPTLMQWYSQFRKETLQYVDTLRKEPKAIEQDTADAIPMPDGFMERFERRFGFTSKPNKPK